MGLIKAFKALRKNKSWEKLAEDIGGEYLQGGIFASDKITYAHVNWKLVLDTYSEGQYGGVHYRIRAPYIHTQEFTFHIYREGFMSQIGKVFGMQDILIGDVSFDEAFIIKSNNAQTIKNVLELENLKAKIMNIEGGDLKVTKDPWGDSLPTGTYQLDYNCPAHHTDSVDELKQVFELFTLILDRLVKLGLAEKTKVQVKYN
ncbi:MAG: hypothetical protein NE334_13480 [Lentisphaeraceae bacterium]|nr:hypothetical protein [Lentisphaeraceae bacterium]